MFDILEADIVVLQETKIQRKDLVDDMVLVPGWDCYWSLPKHKKGYSGVVVFTRQSVCAPIRAEEGITGTLCPPGSSTSFRNGPEDQQIGGYPTKEQINASCVDATILDSEGRCVVLEFPAFVLFGVYSPANRDETRDDFRLGFLDVLDARIRNLVALGKRVFLTGDLNISREELDTANAEATMRKNGYTKEEYLSSPARRIFNQLLKGGQVVGEKDPGRREPVLWDICRGFHPDRKGMFTCWEQKVNARPGNYGSRIDYVLSSLDMKDWFSDSNIQEGLMGSDHCPVYAMMKDQIQLDGRSVHTLDVMNPLGMFLDGQRQRAYSMKDILPISGRLIPEFDGRRNIRDMFARNPSVAKPQSSLFALPKDVGSGKPEEATKSPTKQRAPLDPPDTNGTIKGTGTGIASLTTTRKRSLAEPFTQKLLKRSKSGGSMPAPLIVTGKGQQSLRGFFKTGPTTPGSANATKSDEPTPSSHALPSTLDLEARSLTSPQYMSKVMCLGSTSATSTPVAMAHDSIAISSTQISPSQGATSPPNPGTVHDPVQSKETWSKLFTKPAAPRCEGHDEPCKSMLTRKNGMNRGRSFWMCTRPLGPSGGKEKNTQWRCHTFIWCSDWNPTTTG
ncbi:MAG: hypothetical protein Q9184_000468 [Pyrenodesmia sp. 2 TL-2023]